MKLRAFLATVPLAAVALALPARAESRYIGGMDPNSDKPDHTAFRGWYCDVNWEARSAVFTSVERCSEGRYRMNTEMHVRDADPNHFAQQVLDLEERHSRWACRRQEHPCFLPTKL